VTDGGMSSGAAAVAVTAALAAAQGAFAQLADVAAQRAAQVVPEERTLVLGREERRDQGSAIMVRSC